MAALLYSAAGEKCVLCHPELQPSLCLPAVPDHHKVGWRQLIGRVLLGQLSLGAYYLPVVSEVISEQHMGWMAYLQADIKSKLQRVTMLFHGFAQSALLLLASYGV